MCRRSARMKRWDRALEWLAYGATAAVCVIVLVMAYIGLNN